MGTLPAIAQAASKHPDVIALIVEAAFDPYQVPPWSLMFAGALPWCDWQTDSPTNLDPIVNIRSRAVRWHLPL